MLYVRIRMLIDCGYVVNIALFLNNCRIYNIYYVVHL